MLPVDVLREATNSLHVELERKIGEQPVTTVEGYGRFLSMHGAVLPPVEAWLVGRDDFKGLPDATFRLRTPALRDDLAALNMPMPSLGDVPFLTESSSVFGLCYVLEGSRQGAAYLRKVLSNAGFPSAFLSHQSDRPLWRSFLSRLNALDANSSDMQRTVTSAQKLFEAYIAALK